MVELVAVVVVAGIVEVTVLGASVVVVEKPVKYIMLRATLIQRGLRFNWIRKVVKSPENAAIQSICKSHRHL